MSASNLTASQAKMLTGSLTGSNAGDQQLLLAGLSQHLIQSTSSNIQPSASTATLQKLTSSLNGQIANLLTSSSGGAAAFAAAITASGRGTGGTAGPLLHLIGSSAGGAKVDPVDPTHWRDADEHLAADFDFDFRTVDDKGKSYERGGKPYKRPIGSKRFALKVLGRWENDVWLGEAGTRTRSSSGEWAVAYHGTSDDNTTSILNDGGLRKDKGRRFKFGDGIYVSPDPDTARAYATEFDHEGQQWELILQCRVDPQHIRRVVTAKEHKEKGLNGDYWIVESDEYVRLYGICVYPI